MKSIRILSFVLALLMLVPLFAACKEEPETPPPADSPIVLDLVTEGRTKYTIVYDSKYSDLKTQADAISKTIRERIGANVEVKVSVEGDVNDIPSDYEILLGRTNRSESIDAVNALRNRDYTLKAVNKKLVIAGRTTESTATAAGKFIEMIWEQGNKDAVAGGARLNLSFSNEKALNEIYTRYPYNSCHMADARIDSYYIFYPSGSGEEYKQAALALQDHISKKVGYDLEVYEDNNGNNWADYEILIGNTARTDKELAASLGANEYYIKLQKVEVTYEDGSKHEGAQLLILFGANAMESALNTFYYQIMPASKNGGDLNFADGRVWTNKA